MEKRYFIPCEPRSASLIEDGLRRQYVGLASGSGQNTIRRETIVYPNGKTFTYGYGSSGSMDDKLSRIKTIAEAAMRTLMASKGARCKATPT
jgi:hypothetical protein